MAARTFSIFDIDGAFAAVLARARADEAVLGLWLGGSRGKGRPTVHSDYDFGLVVSDAGLPAWREQIATLPRGLDAALFTRPAFAAYAAWGGPQAWDRYSFVGIKALVDRPGGIQALIDDKACIPPDAVSPFIDASLDHFVNQVYRALKCRRDGDLLASRLEAAQAPQPALDALFALNGSRLRPYAKYLAWELETRPLAASPWASDALQALLLDVLSLDPVPALQALLHGLEPLARNAGHGAVLDAWGPALPWMTTWRPG
ncbi:MAG TPA: nucleotidyltransferase domain-containing protein [Caulobacteraceae bacterium]